MGPETPTTGGLSLLAGFYLGYAAMLAVPGPNVLGVGGIAALRGLRGAAPLCLGTAAGAGALSAALLLCAGAVSPDAGWAAAGQVAGAVLLMAAAASILRRPPLAADAPPVRPGQSPPFACRGHDLAAFAAGFLTAATNPISAAFFAAQFLGPLGAAHDAAMAAPPGVAAMALAYLLAVAALLSRPAPRRLARRWHRPIRLASGGVLLLSAAALLRAALAG